MSTLYRERLSKIQKIQKDAENEISRLKDLRQVLVQKNLSGIFSDEIFKEQNAMIEDQMINAQLFQDDTLVEKYNIETLTTFVKTFLADLGETYKRSTPSQIRVLLGSVFPKGLAWNYDGTLNHKISPIYQAIMDTQTESTPLSGGEGVRTLVSLAGSRFPGVCN